MKKIRHFINNKPGLCLWLAIGLYFLVFSAICVWKYWQFGYNGLDLAIYNQVLFNSAHGRWFEFTFHQQYYLGDHLELLLLGLLPIYYFFQHPITLLILQTAILALSAWPLFLIAKTRLTRGWPLLIALLWLLNPFVQNINLFEFHFLPFAIFSIFWAFYFYLRDKFPWFLLFIVISLLIREDVSLAVFMFSPLAIMDKKSLKWIIWPMALAATWFIIAVKIVAHFSTSGLFKFLTYYGWLGNSFLQLAVNFFAKPWLVLQRLLTPGNLLLAPLLFLPAGFFCLLKPKYLLLALPIFAQLILSQTNNAVIVVKLHYVSLLLPPLFIALIFSLDHLQTGQVKTKLALYLKNNWAIVKLILIVSAVYGLLALGPLPGFIGKLANPTYDAQARQIRHELIETVADQEAVAATYELLTNLSGREKIYSLHYAFIGKTQLSHINYRLPQETEALAVDFSDLLEYQIQFPNNKMWSKYYDQGDDNLRNIIAERGFKAIKIIDTLALFKKEAGDGLELYQIDAPTTKITNRQNLKLNQLLTFLGSTPLPKTEQTAENLRIFPLALYFKADQKINKNYQFKLSLKNNQDQVVHQKLYPLAYGLYPTSEWQPGQVIKSNYWFLLPNKLSLGNYRAELQVLDYGGSLVLDGQRSAVMKISKEEMLWPIIDLGEIFVN
ncbi:MAG: DUF2079 domain-containing protein [Candidatus Komeilibacteria bacterium]|nr:DUF2079 domain-containing protein [Candidatus Komeilibacteria bacterium]